MTLFFPIRFAVGAMLQPFETAVVKLCCAKLKLVVGNRSVY